MYFDEHLRISCIGNREGSRKKKKLTFTGELPKGRVQNENHFHRFIFKRAQRCKNSSLGKLTSGHDEEVIGVAWPWLGPAESLIGVKADCLSLRLIGWSFLSVSSGCPHFEIHMLRYFPTPRGISSVTVNPLPSIHEAFKGKQLTHWMTHTSIINFPFYASTQLNLSLNVRRDSNPWCFICRGLISDNSLTWTEDLLETRTRKVAPVCHAKGARLNAAACNEKTCKEETSGPLSRKLFLSRSIKPVKLNLWRLTLSSPRGNLSKKLWFQSTLVERNINS